MVLYPARVDLPVPRAAKALETLYARASRTVGWAPCYVVGTISAIWGIEGAPGALPRLRARPPPLPR
eukprot:11160384-Lingulodinium_polyedra.AAC.1